MFRSTRSLLLRWMLPLVAIVLSPILVAAQSSVWSSLQQLQPGQKVRIVLNEARSYTGTFENGDDKSITLRSHGIDRTLGRSEIRRVAARTGGHRWRHVAIGAVIGVGAGVAAGAAIGSPGNFVGLTRGKAIAAAAPGFGVLGAAIGAVVPSGGWKTIYSAR